MECMLHSNVDYLDIPMLLKTQKMALVEKMKETSNSRVGHPGIDVRGRKGTQIEDVPGIEDMRWKNNNLSTRNGPATEFSIRDKTSQHIVHKHLQSVLNEVKTHDCAWPLLEPTNAEEAEAIDYYDVVKHPMDLSTMQKQLDKGWLVLCNERDLHIRIQANNEQL
eukprot:gb/GEZJ01004624.1/.p2 GENE.gb/GEZJ01004624.1/~~gb/GEZJ01004624.1/.p2  ORF type:complete len:165 (-),score=29.42 gb/GEZJ01004624.1/:1683-2177(-)